MAYTAPPWTPPSGYSDYFLLELQINYNNSLVNSLEGLGLATTPAQESQAGWNESYLLQGSIAGGPPIAGIYALLQARCGILGVNFYIKKALCHLNSVFKSSYPLPNSAKYGLWDSLSATNIPNQFCNSPEATVLLRGECADYRRYEHQLRGLKDYMANDTVNYLSPSSYAVQAVQVNTGMFDALQQALPMPNSAGGTPAQVTITVSNGVVTSVNQSSAGTFPGVVAGTYPCFFTCPNGQITQAYGAININGINQSTGVTLSLGYGGTGYSGTVATVQVSNDPFGLPNYQTPSAYWANFMSCILAYTGSATIQRISQSTYTGTPKPQFPSGLVPAIVGNALDVTTRCMFQRIGNRQTGQIRLTRKARVKRAI